jgi:hypothetical protein
MRRQARKQHGRKAGRLYHELQRKQLRLVLRHGQTCPPRQLCSSRYNDFVVVAAAQNGTSLPWSPTGLFAVSPELTDTERRGRRADRFAGACR